MEDDTVPKLKRPRGVTILAIIYIISGGFMLLYLSEFGTPLEIFSQISTIQEGIDVYSYILYFVGFAVAGAMLSGKGWGRTLVVILTIIEIVLAAVFLFWDGRQVVVLIIGVVILWYLRKPHVKAYFGQSGAKL